MKRAIAFLWFAVHRAIQQASELGKVQKKLRCKRVSLGSMSEASCVFDSQRLKPIIAELASQSGAVGSTDNSLVKWRLHTHFEIDRYVPTRIDVTPDGRGDNEERPVLERSLESDRLYVMDRDLSQADLDAGVLSDQIISIGQSKKKSDRPDHKVRLICVKCSPHTSRGRYKGTSTGPSSDG